jgi:hypothetical protein
VQFRENEMTEKLKDYLSSGDFKEISFHDNHVYGFSVRQKEFGEDLILDIDYISEWICHEDRTCSFKIIPADLIFSDIVDLEINLSWGKSLTQPDPQYAITHSLSGEIILNGINIENYEEPIYIGYQKYIFEFFSPEKGIMNFGAKKVSLIGRKPPVNSQEQHLDWSQR